MAYRFHKVSTFCVNPALLFLVVLNNRAGDLPAGIMSEKTFSEI
jgi:hypothetical protein